MKNYQLKKASKPLNGISSIALLLALITTVSFSVNSNAKTIITNQDSIQQLLESDIEDPKRVDLLNNMAWLFVNSNSDKALDYARQAQELATKAGYKAGVAEAMYYQALSFDSKGEIKSALEILDEGLDYIEKNQLENTRAEAQTLNAMGTIYDTYGEYDLALEYYLRAYKSYKAIDYSYGIAKTTGNIGMIYDIQGDPEKALEFFLIAKEINTKNDDILGLMFNHINIGVLNHGQGDLEGAIAEWELANNYAEQLDDKSNMALCLGNIGETYTGLGKYDLSLSYNARAMELSTELGDIEGIAWANLRMGQANLGKGAMTIAAEHYKKAIEIATQYNGRYLINDAYQGLAAAYESAGKHKEALEAYQIHIAYKDSMFNEDKTALISDLQTRYETEKKEQEIDLLQKENEIAEASISQQKTLRNALIGGSGLLLIIALLIANRYRLKRKSNEQLKQTNDQLTVAKNTAERSEKLMEQFLSNMSHEIRTPMNAVIGMTNILSREELPDKQQHYVHTIQHSADHLLLLINDILDLSKIQAGQFTLDNSPFDLHDKLQEIIKTIELSKGEKDVDVQLRIEDSVPKVISGDALRLSQVLLNLLGNALKFTEYGMVRLSVNNSKSNGTHGISFEIKDTGIGIPQDKLAEIFKDFTQVDSRVSQKYGGTGLGLSISNKLVDLQGGSIEVESEVGVGTEFRFAIAFTAADENDIKSVANYELAEGDLELVGKLNILLVDDSWINQEVAIDTFKSYAGNAKLEVAQNGEEAVSKVESGNFDLVLMDVQMPIMDGYEATRRIRTIKDEGKNKVPVIAMTASASMNEEKKCFEVGMNDYISKPFQPETLLSKVATHAREYEKL